MDQQVERQTASFIDETAIYAALEKGKRRASRDDAEAIIKKAALADGLTLEEVAVLLNVTDKELVEEIYKTAKQIKLSIYGKRLVLFAPLYVSDYCINNCVYCGYGAGHKFGRRRLTMDEIKKETLALLNMGHKRLAMEAGEDPENCPIDYILDAIKAIYGRDQERQHPPRQRQHRRHHGRRTTRRSRMPISAPTSCSRRPTTSQTYAKVHRAAPSTITSTTPSRIDRAMQGGIDDVGLGRAVRPLRLQVRLCSPCSMHAQHLEAAFGCGPHTISVPRIRPAGGINLSSFPIWFRTTISRS